jgi:(1->4)-alpha-D-glucan 1-alpha-D-glucosylmutase
MHKRAVRSHLLDYEPVMVEGAQGDRLCCFVRQRDDAAVLVAASRFPGASEGTDPPADDTVPISACLQKARLRELLTGRAMSVENGGVAARRLFADLPAAVLVPA